MKTINLATKLTLQTLNLAKNYGFNPLLPNQDQDGNPQSTLQTLTQLTNYLNEKLTNNQDLFISLLPDQNALWAEPFIDYQDLIDQYGQPGSEYTILATLTIPNTCQKLYLLSI